MSWLESKLSQGLAAARSLSESSLLKYTPLGFGLNVIAEKVSGNPTGGEAPGSHATGISGRVVDVEGNGISGATVTLKRERMSTSRDLWSFRYPTTQEPGADGNPNKLESIGQIPVGTYDLLEQVKSGADEFSRIALGIPEAPPSAWIVSVSGGTWATKTAVPVESKTTGGNGEFSFALPATPGLFRIGVEHPDHASVERAWEDASLEIQLGGGLSVSEAELLQNLTLFQGFGYCLTLGQYPESVHAKLDELGTNLADDLVAGAVSPTFPTNNCSTFVEALLIKTWVDKHGAAFGNWPLADHNQVMNIDGVTLDCFDAFVAKGMGQKVEAVESSDDSGVEPAAWTVVQGRSSKSGPYYTGHAFIIAGYHRGKVLILESNSKRYDDTASPNYTENGKTRTRLKPDDPEGPHGPRFKNLGHIDDFAPNFTPSNWWESAPTWEEIKNAYPLGMVLVKLNVTNVQLGNPA